MRYLVLGLAVVWLACAGWVARAAWRNGPPALAPVPPADLHPQISADGSVVAYEAGGSIKVIDRRSGRADLVPGGANGPSSQPTLSGDGRWLVFLSEASNLVAGDRDSCQSVFRYDRTTAELQRLPVEQGDPGECSCFSPSQSQSGDLVAYSSWGNAAHERRLVLYEPLLRELVPLPGGGPDYGSAALSPDGLSLAWCSFDSLPTPNIRLWLADLERSQGVTVAPPECLTPDADGPSYEPSLAGNLCAFTSRASNLVPGDRNGHYDVFLLDLNTLKIRRVGQDPTDASCEPRLSADGRRLVFTSYARNLVPGDDNGTSDVFLYDVASGSLRRLSEGLSTSYHPALSADGSQVVFASGGAVYLWSEQGRQKL